MIYDSHIKQWLDIFADMIGKKGIHAWMADTDVTSGTDIFNAIGRIIVDCKVYYMINSRLVYDVYRFFDLNHLAFTF